MNILRRLIITGIIMLFLVSSAEGVIGVELKEKKENWGYFKGTAFDNGHIIVKIEKDYAVIKDSESGDILVEKAYPVVQIKRGGKWEAVEFEEK
ncbi:MAG: hypothetical protein J7L63_05850, partial [Thermoplasmata archaeon]|nr:hypothetical protein [Thermoplasmata archaeon]